MKKPPSPSVRSPVSKPGSADKLHSRDSVMRLVLSEKLAVTPKRVVGLKKLMKKNPLSHSPLV